MGFEERERGFEEFFHARLGPLHRMAYALTGDWQQAEDLTQATFLRLYLRWTRIRDDNVVAYARKTMTNLYIDDRRRIHRETFVASVPELPGIDPASTPEDGMALGAALESLGQRTRAVLVLRFLEDQSVHQTADLLGMAEGTVKSLTSHGLAALRRQLATPTNQD
jgi:RNA polymerase sigma-70 factor (sigma-E family)